MKRLETHVLTAIITLRSGARIGGSDDVLQIGGTDLTCIKDPATSKPYLPGSSLKGKMRSALEKSHGASQGERPSKQGPIARVFGPHFSPNHDEGPTRIRVHDAPIIGDFTFELKTESVNNRKTGTAMHPRTLERVAPGAQFQLRIDFDVYDIDSDFEYTDLFEKKLHIGRDAILAIVNDGLDLLCQSGIGSGTSRGYGQIDITDDKLEPARRRPRLHFQSKASP
ncbi:MAG TPA: type III-A CRISPR-associated RAMP protein Csm3 [Phycisphaerales bacterium]|nr:type III-A CRISPR-associated RAMP protein Csm3 [Phycisphaerales bacterium]HRQ74546.1 type III-A CRISPR-associated RAMP protein Csm3 [Phycisphaerales bacterium]